MKKSNNIDNNKLIIGIDASNLHGGGGLTHLIEFFTNIKKDKNKNLKLIIWGYKNTLSRIPESSILKKLTLIRKFGFLSQLFWQVAQLSEQAKKLKCDILFIPGGTFLGAFRPYVTMSRNMLPFEFYELKRYGFSFMTLKLTLLRLFQSISIKKANGVIFLSNYAFKNVKKVTKEIYGQVKIIPHGVNRSFFNKIKAQKLVSEYSNDNPFRIIYVSNIDLYKHQWHVAEAISRLYNKGYPIKLYFVGSYYKPAFERLNRKIDTIDPNKIFLKYIGPLHYDDLPNLYQKKDLAIFASSCENLPNILLEKMATGLPIVCSDRGPMPEVLGPEGCYFDPENPDTLELILEDLLLNPDKRMKAIQASRKNIKNYYWEENSMKTLSFLIKVANHFRNK